MRVEVPKDPDGQEQIVLTLTDQAADVVRGLTQDPQAPETAGLRLAPADDGLELSVVAAPVPGDDVIDGDGVRVFVEQQTSQLLEEQTLDATVEEGRVSFFLAAPTDPQA